MSNQTPTGLPASIQASAARLVLLLLLAAFPTTADSAGTSEPVGGEFQVNTYTTDYQSNPTVAADADGDFVVMWFSDGSSGSDTSGGSIQGQRFDSTGAPVGQEFQVNTYTTSGQSRPSVATDTGGSFVAVWRSAGSSGSDSSSWSVQGQRFDAAGAFAGDQFQVNTYTTDYQSDPAVAADADGNFVVVWSSNGSSGSDSSSWSIQGQRIDSAGTAVGDEFQVNTYTTGVQWYPAVGADNNGDFVVVWESYGSSGSDSSGYSVQGQRFDAAGVRIGDEFQVNTFTLGLQYLSDVAVNTGGDFLVVWHGPGLGSLDIRGRCFDSAGAPVGQEFVVNTYTTDFQLLPAVAAQADGGFVVVWQSQGLSGSDSSLRSVQGQRFDSACMPVADQFQVNTYTTNNQWKPALSGDPDGRFVVVWSSNGSSGSDSSWYSIQGQRFINPFFADGFESGDTSAWSNTVPSDVRPSTVLLGPRVGDVAVP